jgi:hypothetical protein
MPLPSYSGMQLCFPPSFDDSFTIAGSAQNAVRAEFAAGEVHFSSGVGVLGKGTLTLALDPKLLYSSTRRAYGTSAVGQ